MSCSTETATDQAYAESISLDSNDIDNETKMPMSVLSWSQPKKKESFKTGRCEKKEKGKIIKQNPEQQQNNTANQRTSKWFHRDAKCT